MSDLEPRQRPDDVLGPLRAYLTATVDEVDAGVRAPRVMLLAFEGWNDAGHAASGALETLREQWEAPRTETLCTGEYYDFQVTRPVVHRDADGLGTIDWPCVNVHEAHLDARGRPVGPDAADPAGLHVHLCTGVEPNVGWRSFTDELLGAARSWGVDAIVTVGSLLADVPHTRPLPAQLSSPQVDLRVAVDAEQPTYEGPTGIIGVVAETAARAGFPTLALWTAVPHYVAQSPSPKALLALVQAHQDLLNVQVNTRELEAEVDSWQRGVDEAAESDADIAAYVRQLEEAFDAQEMPEASGDAIAREFERYLRGRRST